MASQGLSTVDRDFASKDVDAIRSIWSRWDLPVYTHPVKDEFGSILYSDSQKKVLTELKVIFDKWENHILNTAKTDSSKTVKLARFRSYLKEVLSLPEDKFYYRYLPFSLLNFKEDIRAKVNSEYREKKQEIATNVMAKNVAAIGKVPIKKSALNQGVNNAIDLLKSLDSIETVQDFVDTAIAIQLLTGRRISEVVSLESNYKKSKQPGFIQFQGIIKGDEDKFLKSFDIPIIGDNVDAVLAGHAKVKKWLKTNQITIGNHAHTIKQSLSVLFPEITSDCFKLGFNIKSKTHFVRKLYVAYCLENYRSKYVDEAFFIAQILVEGTEKPDGKMIFDTVTAAGYREIILEN